ncbi:MAG TPA: hypothetical protein VKG25_27000 [Bryobacteraceae bacterium]|nr:hypothetical protein [Bryobacteraceae bacterium]
MVITMGSLGGPPEEIGHKPAAAKASHGGKYLRHIAHLPRVEIVKRLIN